MAVNIFKILRSVTAGNRPSGAAAAFGAPYVNFADNQFGVVNASNVPTDLIGIPYFSPNTSYLAQQPVNYQNQLYLALANISAGAWNPANWFKVTTAISGGIASGSVMLFFQAAAPVGWTQVTTQNDKALRVVSGAGGVYGGSNSFSSVMAQSAVGNHTVTLSELPTGIKVNGTASIAVFPNGSSGLYAPIVGAAWGSLLTASAGSSYYTPYCTPSNLTYTATFSGSNAHNSTSNNTGGNPHNHPITMDIQYCDVILASKN